ncbi:MAG: NrfD/PsrC family molybdoenzyme membrane anchor subunit [Planctomycetota bacterium]|jgi:molybdopterin-containing oxidoreductase family membrane subunit
METQFETIEGKSIQFYGWMVLMAALAVAGLVSSYIMFEQGIYLSGMTNRIPWGLQVILAVFYIGLSAGSLVISSLYGIFGKVEYKPFARIAVFLAFLFLVAALLSIISDWGRPDRILEPFSNFNFMSMLSINPFLYNVYMFICIVYLWAMFTERKRFVPVIAVIAVLWAIGVHSGTGAIFGFTQRELYQSPLLPPSFIAAALSSGTACMILVILALFRITRRPLNDELVVRLGKLLAIFIVGVLYFIFVENMYRWYLAESREASLYFLFGGEIGVVFWGGMILLGSILPAVILFNPKTGRSIPWIVPGQTHSPELFPNMEVTQSAAQEGIVTYSISFYEVLQALGVVGIIGFAFVLGLRLFRMLPSEAKAAEEKESFKSDYVV